MADIKSGYQKLANKYTLPSYNDIDLDFEISAIDQDKFLLREIRRKILNKFDGIKNILVNIIQPDTNSFESMYETRAFDDEEKKKIYNIYKSLMVLDRAATVTNLKSNEKEDAEFIKKTFGEWKKLKADLLPILEKIKDSWKKETNVKEDLGYLG